MLNGQVDGRVDVLLLLGSPHGGHHSLGLHALLLRWAVVACCWAPRPLGCTLLLSLLPEFLPQRGHLHSLVGHSFPKAADDVVEDIHSGVAGGEVVGAAVGRSRGCGGAAFDGGAFALASCRRDCCGGRHRQRCLHCLRDVGGCEVLECGSRKKRGDGSA